jgi:hypothetical protein
MALSYTTYVEPDPGFVTGGDVSSTSRTYNSGELVTVVWVGADNQISGNTFTVSVSNTNTAQTWSSVVETNTNSNCKISVHRCVMSTTQAMVITAAGSERGGTLHAHMFVIVESGQHATTPIPAGNVASTASTADYSRSITPTATGSDLWAVAADWNQTNTFAAIANCTLIAGVNVSGQYTTTLIRPTTQPRGDASAFTIGETDTGGIIVAASWEVQADGGGGGGGNYGVFYIKA